MNPQKQNQLTAGAFRPSSIVIQVVTNGYIITNNLSSPQTTLIATTISDLTNAITVALTPKV